MGGLRPFGSKYFEEDGIVGYGGEKEPKRYHGTGTPTLAQYLVFEDNSDRVIFYLRNAGSYEGYRK